MAMNLLTDEIISIQMPDGTHQRVSLPELLARLTTHRVERLTAVRAHQEVAAHSFLVSVAVMGLEAAEQKALPESTDTWRQVLRCLTPDHPGDEPWQLLVEDWAKPAFMQVPCAPVSEASYKKTVTSPQSLDVLVPGRGHELKPDQMRSAAANDGEPWMLALVSLGADACFTGRDTYGGFRKNGGYAARSHVRLAIQRGLAAEFARDVRVLLELGETLHEQAAACGVGTRQRKTLLWTEPWTDADGAIALAEVHPLCLEVPRRVRLRRQGKGALFAVAATSKKARVLADECRGVVGDPWAVIVREAKGDKGWNPQLETGGLSYRRLAPVLFDRMAFTLPLLALPAKDERTRSGTLVIRALGRGQGGTDGLLEREVRVPPVAMSRFSDAPHELDQLSKQFLELASAMSGKVLRAALLVYGHGSAETDRKNKDFGAAAAPWQAEFEALVDRSFFEELLDSVQAGLDHQAARRQWVMRLFELATDVFARATEALPTRDRSRVLARARAASFLRNAAFKQFPSLKPAATAPDGINPENGNQEETDVAL